MNTPGPLRLLERRVAILEHSVSREGAGMTAGVEGEDERTLVARVAALEIQMRQAVAQRPALQHLSTAFCISSCFVGLFLTGG